MNANADPRHEWKRFRLARKKRKNAWCMALGARWEWYALISTDVHATLGDEKNSFGENSSDFWTLKSDSLRLILVSKSLEIRLRRDHALVCRTHLQGVSGCIMTCVSGCISSQVFLCFLWLRLIQKSVACAKVMMSVWSENSHQIGRWCAVQGLAWIWSKFGINWRLCWIMSSHSALFALCVVRNHSSFTVVPYRSGGV